MKFSGNKMPYWLQLLFFVLGLYVIGVSVVNEMRNGGSLAYLLAYIPFVGIWIYGLINLIRAMIYERRERKLYEDENRLKGRDWDESARSYRRYSTSLSESRFCPYCGAAAEEDFSYCNVCGKPFPEKSEKK